MEKYIAGEPISREKLAREEQQRVQDASLFPVYHGSAKNGLGIQPLMDAVTGLFQPIGEQGGAALCGSVFKVEYTDCGQRRVYLRLYSGTLRLRDTVAPVSYTHLVRYALHRYLGADTSDYTYEILKFFMLGAVSRVFRPGVKFDYIICVVGDQGAGKSSFFRLLAVEDEWFTDDLKDLESNKVYEKLQGHWIIELSEMLATNNAKSNEAIKSFLSRQKEIYRTPYERYPKDRPRQCVFAGTTNKISFLPSDRTGNRRFLPIACQESEAEVFILDNEAESRAYIRQMWAEVMAIWKSGKVKLKLCLLYTSRCV